ncbi:MAG: LacI family DNA-binding transcriptional regulator [Anaerolineaceae bacterium]|nr:LacI family DNA-binding transcriptional regulator [Anaerolineaceae bacterium]
MPTVRQIAQHAGVAKSTVSLVMNHKPGVSDKTRQIVLNAYQELNSQNENNPADYLEKNIFFNHSRYVTKKPLSFVVFHPAILGSNQVFSELLAGIQFGADLYHAQLRLAINERKIPPAHVSNLYLREPSLQPDGILIIGARSEEPILEEAIRQQIPYVIVSRTKSDPSISAVGRDEVKITMEAVNYLLELGHTAIGFVGGNPLYSYTNQRIQGYQKALQTSGITPLDRWVSLGAGKEAAKTILRTSPEITAIIFVNDTFAMEALPVFIQAGHQIPDTLSVISFDDTDQAKNFIPPITSIQHPRYEEGAWAVRVLVEKIRNPFFEECQIILKSKLIIRDSCTRPK